MRLSLLKQTCGVVTLAVPEPFFAEVSGRLEYAWPLQDISYGRREFAVKDSNGYTVLYKALELSVDIINKQPHLGLLITAVLMDGIHAYTATVVVG